MQNLTIDFVDQKPQPQGLQIDFVDQPKRVARGPLEAAQAGYQGSATGLMLRGKLPDIQLDPQHSKWYERLAAGAAQIGSELPQGILGAIGMGAAGTATAGPVGGLLAGGAGAFAVPAAIRQSYIEAYSKGEITSTADFLNRASIVLKQTGKEGVVGLMTAGAGAVAMRTVGAAIAPSIGTAISVPTAQRAIGAAGFAAEGSALVVTPALLEGRMPEPQDFVDAAVLMLGFKGATVGAKKLADIYAKTGKTPIEVMADASRDPTIKEDLTRTAEAPKPGEQPAADTTSLPRAYQGPARQELLANVLGEDRTIEIKAVADNPIGRITPTKEPNHINYRYVDGPDDVKAVQARIAEVFKPQIEAMRGTETWAQTQEKAAERLRNMRPEDVAGRSMESLAAEGMAMQAMGQRAAFDLAQIASEIRAVGAEATPEMFAKQAQAIEMLALLHAVDQGNGAAIARALNARKAARNVTALGKEASEMMAKYGENPQELARRIGELGNADELTTFARKASEATTYEKLVEGWKAGLVSGPITHMKNLMGNVTLIATRPLIDTVAVAMNPLARVLDRSTKAERMSAVEPLARVWGNVHSVFDASRAFAAVIATGEPLGGRAEIHRKAIEGKLGEVVRLPFRLLSATDAFFRTVAEQGEAHALAVREAAGEGLNPATREFQARVAELVANPTDKMIERIEAAGLRYTFQTPLGEKGRAVQDIIRKLHLEWAVPFVQTPVNVAKEMLRLTPAAPVIKEWRDAIAKGGPEAQQAVAEIAVGSAVGATVFALALSDNITGQGDPDPNKRRVALANGWQPYSVKIGDKYYSYQALQPLGTLVGMYADAAAVWDRMSEQESDKVAKMIATAFANAITNQTFLQGITNLINAISDPERFGPRFVQSYAASLVPGLIGQPAAMLDPYQREIYDTLDAVRARIPGAREDLMPKRDPFGQPVEARDRLAGISPITTTQQSDDRVRAEAARLGIGVAQAPDYIELPAGRDRKLGRVELTPEQRDIFATAAGERAHQILSAIVSSPGWDSLPDMTQRNVMERVFERSRKAGKSAAVPPEQIIQEVQRISDELQLRLQPK